MSLNTTLPPRYFFTLTAKKTLVRATGDITLMYFYSDSFVAQSAFLVRCIHPRCTSLGSTAHSMLRTQLTCEDVEAEAAMGWMRSTAGRRGWQVITHCGQPGPLDKDISFPAVVSCCPSALFWARSGCDNGQYLLMHLIMSKTWKNGCSFALEKNSPCFHFPCKSSFPCSQHSSPCNNHTVQLKKRLTEICWKWIQPLLSVGSLLHCFLCYLSQTSSFT